MKNTKRAARGGAVRASASGFGIEAGADGNAKIAITQHEESAAEREEAIYTVKALPDARWEILALAEDYLDGLYIQASDPLCKIIIRKKCFEIDLSITLQAVANNIHLIDVKTSKSAELIYGMVARLAGKTDQRNVKEKAIQLLIAKALRTRGDRIEVVRQRLRPCGNEELARGQTKT